MIETYRIATAFLGIFIGFLILLLLRKDILHVRHSLWWFFMSFSIIMLGIFPGIIDVIGSALGVSYPPTLAIVVAFCILLIKILFNDIERSKQEIKLRRLAQRMAMLEGNEHESDN